MLMKRISMLVLKTHFDALPKNELILDVRTVGEFASGHVPNAKNIPLDVVMNHAEELKPFDTVYVHCAAGRRSQAACEILTTLGLENLICVDEGGFLDWEEAGYPSVRTLEKSRT